MRGLTRLASACALTLACLAPALAIGPQDRQPQPMQADASSMARLQAAVRAHLQVDESQLPDRNIEAEVEILSTRTGRITQVKLIRSSGVQAWDAAVIRAVHQTRRLPQHARGDVPERIHAVFRPE